MTPCIAFQFCIPERYEIDSLVERYRRLGGSHVEVDREILKEVMDESFVGQFIRDEGIEWRFNDHFYEVELLNVTDAQLVALRLALSDNERLFFRNPETEVITE